MEKTKGSFEKLIIKTRSYILQALKKIDDNQKGFLIVIDQEDVVCGTLTDGDIRRALISGKTPEDLIDGIYSGKFKFLKNTDTIVDAIETFRDSSIDFLPILLPNHHLYNVITKKQMHVFLLQDSGLELSYEFEKLNESLLDHEIYGRPWGLYKTTMLNEYYRSKMIKVNPGEQLSLQSHRYREEYWVIVHGKGEAQIGESIIDVQRGSFLFIPKDCRHRITNISETESLVISEVQIGRYLEEDDIVRYEDRYGRVTDQEGT